MGKYLYKRTQNWSFERKGVSDLKTNLKKHKNTYMKRLTG